MGHQSLHRAAAAQASAAALGLSLALWHVSSPGLAAERVTQTPSSLAYRQIESEIGEEFARGKGGALALGVIQDGRLVWSKSYGFSGAAAKVPASSQTIYGILSVTKVATGLMLLQLVEQGVVHLTDPVERYVPEVHQIANPFTWSPPVTLIQLATMTGGIGDHAPLEHPRSSSWDQNLIAVMPYLKFDFEPGTRRRYANISYAILGLALSRAAHRPYAQYVERAIFRPLGMNDTHFSVSRSERSRLAYPQGLPPVFSWEQSELLPAAGVFSTLEDMTKLMRFQLGLGPQAVLSASALEDSYRLVVPSDGDLQYGDGIGVAAVRSSDSNLAALGHGGHGLGYIAVYEFDRSERSGIIVLSTHYTDDYKPIVRAALKKLHPASSGGTGLPAGEEH